MLQHRKNYRGKTLSYFIVKDINANPIDYEIPWNPFHRGIMIFQGRIHNACNGGVPWLTQQDEDPLILHETIHELGHAFSCEHTDALPGYVMNTISQNLWGSANRDEYDNNCLAVIRTNFNNKWSVERSN